ncbi:MAG: hypothetical protein J1E35_07875 [Lachnospiraceae bacterium]|nr:hypothetical protein [Lachnospiraceae bacterium]
MEQNTEKKLTKYDRKILARQAAAKREQRNRIISMIAVAAVVVCIVAVVVLVPIMRRRKALREYMKINDISVSQLEFSYYKYGILNSYAQFLPYLGLDTSVPFDQQIYDSQTGMTWNDFFEQQAAISVRETKAMINDITKRGLTFDVTEDYDIYMAAMRESAAEASMSLNKYLSSSLGVSATEKSLEPIIKEDLTALAYYSYLSGEELAATDEDAQKEYDENKNDYDSVDYRVLEFAADVTAESTEDEIAAAMEAAAKRAQEMLDKLKAGEDFETLCASYAPEDKREDYADSETDKSLVTGATTTSSFSSYTEWLFEEERTEGESTLFTDEDRNTCYVLLFEKRYLADTVMDNIKQTLTYNAVTDYISTLTGDYIITDPHGNLGFMNLSY